MRQMNSDHNLFLKLHKWDIILQKNWPTKDGSCSSSRVCNHLPLSNQLVRMFSSLTSTDSRLLCNSSRWKQGVELYSFLIFRGDFHTESLQSMWVMMTDGQHRHKQHYEGLCLWSTRTFTSASAVAHWMKDCAVNEDVAGWLCMKTETQETVLSSHKDQLRLGLTGCSHLIQFNMVKCCVYASVCSSCTAYTC